MRRQRGLLLWYHLVAIFEQLVEAPFWNPLGHVFIAKMELVWFRFRQGWSGVNLELEVVCGRWWTWGSLVSSSRFGVQVESLCVLKGAGWHGHGGSVVWGRWHVWGGGGLCICEWKLKSYSGHSSGQEWIWPQEIFYFIAWFFSKMHTPKPRY